jgi:predicted acyl esterase
LRWWDHWLKGIDSGIMDEPMLRSWMLDSARPSVSHPERPGHWVSNTSWPPSNCTQQRFFLNPDGLGLEAGKETLLDHQ